MAHKLPKQSPNDGSLERTMQFANVGDRVGVVIENSVPHLVQDAVQFEPSPAGSEDGQEDVGFHILRHESRLVLVLEMKVLLVNDIEILHLFRTVRQQQ